MKIWVDAHISPGIAAWINENYRFEAMSLRAIGLREAKDIEIFRKGKQEEEVVVLVSKDTDFLDLIALYGWLPAQIVAVAVWQHFQPETQGSLWCSLA